MSKKLRFADAVFWHAICHTTVYLAVGSLFAQEATESVFLRTPRVLRQRLSRAQEALDEDRIGDAVTDLGALLSGSERFVGDQETQQDYFIGTLAESGTHTSLKTEARRLLGLLPPRGRELYELQYGAEARSLLERAVREGDLQDLNEVTRRYFHTKAGYEATLLLGRLHLDQGRPLAARLCFQMLSESPDAGQYEPELSLLLAASFARCQQPEKASETLDQLRLRSPRVNVRIGDATVRNLPPAAEERDWLQHYLGGGHATLRVGEMQWLMHRGNASRNASSIGGVPLRQYRWKAPTPTDPLDETLVEELLGGFQSEGRPMVPALSPLAVRDVVLMRTPDRLIALDFENGKRIWRYPWDLSDERIPVVDRVGMQRTKMSYRERQLTQRLWRDAAYGQISSDGDSVFFVSELRFAMKEGLQWIPRPMGGRRPNPDLPLTHNRLVALDLEREGYYEWMVGGETGLDEPRLAGAFFLGPPLPLFGQLYVLAEIRGEIRLVVLDAVTGKLSWFQQLAHVDSFNIGIDRDRRMLGASPSFADGVLVCPTSAGAVVAVDIATRSLLWGNQYAMDASDPTGSISGRNFPRYMGAPVTHWLDATATIAEGHVLLTPPRSNRLFCYDLVTGKPSWKPPVRNGDLSHMLFVACVHDGRVVLVGQHSVVALKLDDGTAAWKASIEFAHSKQEVPSGRGFLGGKYYYLPTTASRLLKIDVEQGTVVSATPTGQPLGNLVCYKDQVISQGADQVAIFHQVEPLRRQVADRLAKSPNDAWALARQGELYLNDEDLSAAFASLRKALQIEPEDPEIRTLVVSTFLEALSQDFEKYHGIAKEVEPLIDQPSRRLEYLRRMAAGQQDLGHPEEALAAYLELIDLLSRESAQQGLLARTPVPIDSTWSARTDLWVRARLARLYRAADDTWRGQMDTAVRERLDVALARSSERLAIFRQVFGFHPLADRATLQLGNELLASDDLLEAELTLGELLGASNRDIEAAAVAALAEVYRKAQQLDLAARCYRQLATRWPDVVCREGQTGQQIWEVVEKDEMLREGIVTQSEWPWGRTDWEETNEGLSRLSQRRVYGLPIVSRRGPESRVGSVTYDTGGSSVVVRNRYGQQIGICTISGNFSFYGHQPGMTRAATWGHALFLALADQIAMVDTLTIRRDDPDPALWRKSLTQMVLDIRPLPVQSVPREAYNPLIPTDLVDYYLADEEGRPLGQTGPVTRFGICYLKARTLICADPLTGETRWSRSNVDDAAELFGDGQFIFVRKGKGDQVMMLDAIDGRLLGHRSVPGESRPWTIHGRFLLCWEKEGAGTRLYLFDVANSKTSWSERFERGSRGCLVGNRHVAVLRPNGQFLVRSLEDDQRLVDQPLEPEAKLGRIHAFVRRSQLMLLTSSNSAAAGKVNGGAPVIPITGKMYAFSLSTGEPTWQVPARLEDYGFPMDQPIDSPVLWFFRQYSEQSPLNPSAQIRSAVACVDCRTGQLLFEAEDLRSQLQYHEMMVDRVEQTARLAIPEYTLNVRFTEEPTPPAPTAQIGDSAGRRRSLLNSLLEGEANESPFDTKSDEAPTGEKPLPEKKD